MYTGLHTIYIQNIKCSEVKCTLVRVRIRTCNRRIESPSQIPHCHGHIVPESSQFVNMLCKIASQEVNRILQICSWLL